MSRVDLRRALYAALGSQRIRERQLAAVIEEAEMQKRLVAEKSVIIGHLQRELEKQDRQMSDGVQEKGV